MYTLHVEKEVAISHQLKFHEGKCSNLHGHNLLVKVDIKAQDIIRQDKYTQDGMIMDFGKIKRLIDGIDHTHINDIFESSLRFHELGSQPTAERIAEYFANAIYRHSENSSITEIKVEVHEATNQYVTYTLNVEGE